MHLDLIEYSVERMNLPNPIQVMFELVDYYLVELYQYSNQFVHQDFQENHRFEKETMQDLKDFFEVLKR
jgi:hypothetical protein